MSGFDEYCRVYDEKARFGEPPKGAKCKHCGSKVKKNLIAINTCGDYVCDKCWREHVYEYDATPP